ncbi:short chain dehydrogenase [Pochonia chlamydosporia 170]|uniref:Short chain dehydrogenase n=1 Tax=Pochonia chlamydosporia 170 TaxID=1380566 RepID=A0A179F3F3_METCM|nr:short chain dehydrogenase [Pochonia chlamydosporia 170]OAQ59937.1 short chain dehydrogenase [Pochonia chlamydosporia 170]
MTLHRKTVIVTGAAGGLGRQIALTYLQRGANVVICDVNEARLTAVCEELASVYPGNVVFHITDVTDEIAVQQLIESTVQRFGRVDVVVNNAAVMDTFDPAATCTKSLWDSVIAVNLTGPFLVTKHAVAQMEKQERQGGLIINIGSNASFKGLAGGIAYVASKHGIVGVTKNTASFYGKKGIYSVALLLGCMTDTNIGDAFAQGLNHEGLGMMQTTQPAMEAVPTEHVARYAAFLSEEGIAKSANGSCIVINGNWPEA